MGRKNIATKTRTQANAVRQLINEIKDPITGNFFHTWNDPETKEELNNQGQIIGKAAEGMYLVRIFDWVMGQENGRKIVTVNEIAKWTLYATNADMHDALRVYEERRGQR